MTARTWKSAEELVKAHDQGTGIWLKLAGDGDKATVVFLGDPLAREVVFAEGRYVPVDSRLKTQPGKVVTRVAINVALYETKEVKVFEMSAVLFTDLHAVHKRMGLENWGVEIERSGAAKDPKTKYRLFPVHNLTEDQRKLFASLPRHDLEKLYAAAAQDAAAAPSVGTYDQRNTQADATQVVQELTAQLKLLPRAAVDKFLMAFGVQRIREVPAAQWDNARALVVDLAREFGQPPPAKDIDPFAD